LKIFFDFKSKIVLRAASGTLEIDAITAAFNSGIHGKRKIQTMHTTGARKIGNTIEESTTFQLCMENHNISS
jgi:hypothetical protein